MTSDFEPLTVQGYAARALTTDQRSDAASLAFPLLGLFGETGSLLSEVKKKQRDRVSYVGYAAAVVEELGDMLWYLTAVASRVGLSLGDIAYNVSLGCSDYHSGDAPDLSFAALQPKVVTGLGEPTPAFEQTLLRLAGEVGLLVTDWRGGNATDDWATNGLAVERLTLIPNDSEAARFQLLNVPEVAAATMLFESQDEEITSTAIDPRTGVALSEQPDIGAVICRPVFLKNRDLEVTRFNLCKIECDGRSDQAVLDQRPTGSFVACTDAQRELVDHVGSRQVQCLPTLPLAMPAY